MATKNDNVVTIHRVAQVSGVSIATVSRVVNGRDRVAPETRRKVERVIEQLSFEPNSRAQSLSRKCTGVIGLVVPDFTGDYFTKLMEGAHQEAQINDKQIMVLKAKGHKQKVDVLRRLCGGGRADAVVLMLDELHNSVLDSIEDTHCPLVILDRDVRHRRFDNILVDNHLGGYEAARHFLDLHGVRNLFFVGGPENNVDTIDRMNGFSEAISEFPEDVVHKEYFCGDYGYDSGIEMANKNIASIVSNDDKKWGIVAANDDIACGLVDGLMDAGIAVPSQVGVIGFDDSRIAVRRKLKLSTMRVPVKEVGQAAVRMVIGRLVDSDREPAKVVLKTKLVIRQSCGCDSSV